MQLYVRVIALRTIGGPCGVGAKTSLCMLGYIFECEHQSGALASKITFAPFAFVVTLFVLGLAIL